VLTYGPTPRVEPGEWQLRVSGLVAAERVWSWEQFQALPRRRVTADFHCVTRFSTLDNDWEGVAQACYGGYTTNLPLEDLLSERAVLADRHHGAPLPVDHGGPVRLVVPHLYAWKSAKWVNGIELRRDDQRGFWERAGYHVYGDPWREERFSSQETREAYQVRRRAKELGLVPGHREAADAGEGGG
jgi:DMSO/TMAO reductase YedYZ molybdopterin-dependent catalytic subunit